MVHRKIVHHFLPHFFVDKDIALKSENPQHYHHKAHGLSLFSLFTYLQIVIILSAGLFLIKIKAPGILGTITFSPDQIIQLTNQKRQENGLSTVTYNPLLAKAAAAKAANMFSENYWSHYAPSGKTPWTFITSAGYRYVFAGENLARDFEDPNSVVTAWMNSPSHRSNILDKNFKEIGVAVVSGTLTGHEGILVVQMFGTGVSTAGSSKTPRASTQGVAQAIPESEATSGSSPSAELTQTETESVANEEPESQATVLSTRQFSLAKGISLGLIGLIFAMFAAEAIITFRHQHLRVRPQVLAHLALLAFVLFALWYAVGGAIL